MACLTLGQSKNEVYDGAGVLPMHWLSRTPTVQTNLAPDFSRRAVAIQLDLTGPTVSVAIGKHNYLPYPYRTMCCDDKCMFFISVRTGSLIFGYIAAVISGIGVLSFTGLFLYLFTVSSVGPGHLESDSVFIAQMLFIEFIAGFTFTVLLLFGITHNKPALIKSYIVYGMIHLGLLLCVDIVLFCTCLPVFGILAFLGCGIYTLLIYMTYLTYKGMINSGNAYHPQININPPIVLA